MIVKVALQADFTTSEAWNKVKDWARANSDAFKPLATAAVGAGLGGLAFHKLDDMRRDTEDTPEGKSRVTSTALQGALLGAGAGAGIPLGLKLLTGGIRFPTEPRKSLFSKVTDESGELIGRHPATTAGITFGLQRYLQALPASAQLKNHLDSEVWKDVQKLTHNHLRTKGNPALGIFSLPDHMQKQVWLAIEPLVAHLPDGPGKQSEVQRIGELVTEQLKKVTPGSKDADPLISSVMRNYYKSVMGPDSIPDGQRTAVSLPDRISGLYKFISGKGAPLGPGVTWKGMSMSRKAKLLANQLHPLKGVMLRHQLASKSTYFADRMAGKAKWLAIAPLIGAVIDRAAFGTYTKD